MSEVPRPQATPPPDAPQGQPDASRGPSYMEGVKANVRQVREELGAVGRGIASVYGHAPINDFERADLRYHFGGEAGDGDREGKPRRNGESDRAATRANWMRAGSIGIPAGLVVANLLGLSEDGGGKEVEKPEKPGTFVAGPVVPGEVPADATSLTSSNSLSREYTSDESPLRVTVSDAFDQTRISADNTDSDNEGRAQQELPRGVVVAVPIEGEDCTAHVSKNPEAAVNGNVPPYIVFASGEDC